MSLSGWSEQALGVTKNVWEHVTSTAVATVSIRVPGMILISSLPGSNKALASASILAMKMQAQVMESAPVDRIVNYPMNTGE